MTEFRILGPLEVVDDAGEAIPLGGAKQRSVLAALLLRLGETVSRDYLIDSLWAGNAPRTAATSLHNSISALRKALGPNVVVTKPSGYALAVDVNQVDLGRFERLVRDASGHEPVERAAILREALSLWRGEPLAEFAYEPFAEGEVRRLDELRLGAVEDWVDAELEAGRNAELVPELEAHVARQPLRERLRAQLMLALYRAGRQADALAAYQDIRRTLADELGLEPGPQLQQLQQKILRQSVSIHPSVTPTSSDEHIEQVAAALKASKVVPVLGTNVSELAERLAEHFGYPPSEPGDLARVAQYVSLTKGSGPLYEELHSLLGTGIAPSPVHRFFASLPPLLRERGVPHMLLVTTGYDLALEQALLDAGEEFDVVSYVASGRDRGRFRHILPDGTTRLIDLPNTYATELSLDARTIVLKLHGGVDASPTRERESFVVTEDDYIDYLAYGEAAAIPVALAAKLRRSHFLFLGYGMRDWNVRLVLGRMWGGEGVAWRSWAVQSEANPLEKQLWRDRDVDLLEVPLDEYVGALARFLGVDVEVLA